MPGQLAAVRTLDPSRFVAVLDAMAAHDIRLFTDLTMPALQACLALTPPARPVVSLALPPAETSETCIEAALDQIGRAMSRIWPFLYGGEDFSGLRDDALSRAHLPVRFANLARRLPTLHLPFACDLVIRLMQARPPRLHNVPAMVEWAQATLAFAPKGLVIAVFLKGNVTTPACVRALEWMAQAANVRVAILTDDADAEVFERVAYGARRLSPHGTTAEMPAETSDEVSLAIALPPAPEGRPHPMSPIEQKLHRCIQADDELRPLFVFNKTVRLPLLDACVDLVWLDGRVAVEIDGSEHRAAAKFRADRHRDYQLMCAGFRVLRMTNEEVETDAALALEKIRDVARLAQGERR